MAKYVRTKLIFESDSDSLKKIIEDLKNENKVIGITQLTNIDLINGTAGGGIWIIEKYWGRGYGTEAFGARIRYAFEDLKLWLF